MTSYYGVTNYQTDTPYQSTGQEKGDAMFDIEAMGERKSESANPENVIGTFVESDFLVKHSEPLIARVGYGIKAKKPLVLSILNGALKSDYRTVKDFYKSHYVVGIQSSDQPFITAGQFTPIVGGDMQVRFDTDGFANEDFCVVVNPDYGKNADPNPLVHGWAEALRTNEWGKPTGRIGMTYVAMREVQKILREPRLTKGSVRKAIQSLANKLNDTDKKAFTDAGSLTTFAQIDWLCSKSKSFITTDEQECCYHVGWTLARDIQGKESTNFFSGVVDQSRMTDEAKKLDDEKRYIDYIKKLEDGDITIKQLATLTTLTEKEQHILDHYIKIRNRKGNELSDWNFGRLIQDTTKGKLTKIKIRE